ncbi:MAG: Bax inhibitor-1/YccA family protein [Treponema sp.]|nr:Bax inhibitor-1/YccA family protein [Treponema sp.]
MLMENVGTSFGFAESEKSMFISKTYGWMAVALLVSAFFAFLTKNLMFTSAGYVTSFGKFMLINRGIFIFAIAEVALVWILSSMIRKISVQTAIIGFLAYAVLNGVTLSSILIVYRIGSIASCFFGSAAMFGLMSLYGAKTKKDLSSWGKYLIMALIGVIITNLIQILIGLFTGADFRVLDFLLSIVTVVIFTGLTAYDTQKLVRVAEYANGSDDYKKVSIFAALELYLDFINLFLTVLRIFGRRR